MEIYFLQMISGLRKIADDTDTHDVDEIQTGFVQQENMVFSKSQHYS